LLSEGEEVVLDLRPHWIALVLPVAMLLLVAGAVIALLVLMPDTWPSWVSYVVVAAAIVFALAVPGPRIVAWATSHFVVTTDRLIHRSGLIARRSMEIPLENINDVKFHQGVFERTIGAGDLTIESAGEFGQERFGDIRDPEHVHTTIFEAMERNQRRMVAPASATAGGQGSMAEELERLDRLRQQGVLSEDEFRAQKARLLGS
jgi:uncharacterized membrane protein YdbT with pleckstrin-like domain